MFVITSGATGDAVVIEQLLRLARVFASDHVGLLEHAQSSQGNVFQIANRSGHQIEPRCKRAARIDDRGGFSGLHFSRYLRPESIIPVSQQQSLSASLRKLTGAVRNPKIKVVVIGVSTCRPERSEGSRLLPATTI